MLDWNSWQQWASGWINWLVSEDRSLIARMTKLEKGMQNMSDEMVALKTAFESYKTDVSGKVAALNTAVTNLTAQLAADSTDSQAIKDLTAEVTAAQADLDGAANPVAGS